MPANHRLGRDHDQSLLPSRPEPVGNDPEQFVEAPQHGSRAATLQHSELLSERKILQGKTPTAMKHASERSEPEKKQIEHGPELYQNHGRTLQQVTDSTVGQSFGEAQAWISSEISNKCMKATMGMYTFSRQAYATWTICFIRLL
jgi:hypothetical protein